MSDLVETPEYTFSHDEAYICSTLCFSASLMFQIGLNCGPVPKAYLFVRCEIPRSHP